MKKIIAMILITILAGTFISQGNEVFAKDSEVNFVNSQNNYVNGSYEVSNKVLKVDSDEESSARKYVDYKSIVEISNNGTYASLNFNQRNLMTQIGIKIDGEEIQYVSKEEGDTNLQVTFPLNNLNSTIEVSAIINTGFFKMPVTFRIILDTSNIPVKDKESSSVSKFINGKYTVQTNALKIDSDEASSASKYVNNESQIIITDNYVKAIVNFSQRKLMTDISIKINGENINYESSEEGENDLHLIIPLEDADSVIEVSSKINTGFMTIPVSFRITFDTSSIPLNGSESDKANDDFEDINSNLNQNNQSSNNQSVSNSGSTQTAVETTGNKVQAYVPAAQADMSYSIYKIQNEIITTSSVGYTAARAAISTSSYVEKYGDDTYITLGISQLDVMNNIRIAVNGSNVAYEIVRQDTAMFTMDIRFKVNSISDDIKVTAYINVTGMDISFGIDLLENTMELISKSEASGSLTSGSASNASITNLSDNSESSLESEELSADTSIEIKSYYKKYTIENDIECDSAIGKSMARKYIDKVCILDEIDGQYYLTIKILSSNSMSNIKVEVNGQETEYQVVSKDSDGNMAIKFKIKDIDDSIRMYMLIASVNRNVDFGIKLLEDTMTLIDEGVVSEDTQNTKDEILENYMSQNSSDNGSNKKIIIISSVVTMAVIFLVEGVVVTVVKRRKNIKNDIECKNI